MPDRRAAEPVAYAAFWEAQEPWLAAAILISGWGDEAAREALSRAANRERAGDAPAADFWVAVHGCIRSLG